MTWRRVWIGLALAAWIGGVCAAFYGLWRYKLTPGELAHAPERWPDSSKLQRAPGMANVVMVAHPRCPCTTASMTELARLADELQGRAAIHVVIVRPDGAEPGFEDGAIADRARRIPGAEVLVDAGGHEAERFGAIVSGSTIVYGADGALVFRGGLTTARGHEGRGPAHDAIAALVDGKASARHEAPTFGCDLTARAP